MFLKTLLALQILQDLQEMLLIQNSELNNYIPFDLSSLTSKFMNYSIVLFPLEKLLEIYLSNRFGYNTLVSDMRSLHKMPKLYFRKR